jgi:transcription elongation factor GreA
MLRGTSLLMSRLIERFPNRRFSSFTKLECPLRQLILPGGIMSLAPFEILMTEQIKKKLHEELNKLERELAYDIPRELKKAVALGDLSENAEYHTAKQRQEYLKARVRQLGKRLADLSLINMNNIPRDKVGLGSTVKVYDSAKEAEVEYQLVMSEESDVEAGKISTTSPIGRALLNKKVGDSAIVVTPNGNREMEVLKLSTIHDLAAELETGPEPE